MIDYARPHRKQLLQDIKWGKTKQFADAVLVVWSVVNVFLLTGLVWIPLTAWAIGWVNY